LRFFKRLNDRIRLHSNIRNIRFPTLTRLMINPPGFVGSYLENLQSYSDEFIKNVCSAYNAAHLENRAHDVWSEITNHSAKFERALLDGHRDDVARQLATMFQSNLLVGMAHSAVHLSNDSPYGKAYFGLRVRDSLLALAEALAIKGVESNHQTSFSEHVRLTNGDVSALVAPIEAKLGHSISPPDFGQPAVVSVGQYFLNPDFIRHAYAMHRIEMLGFSKAGGVLEIGGGFGCVARFASIRGFEKITVVDLPFANAAQAGFLAGTLGEDRVRFHNSSADRDNPGNQKIITLWPSTLINQMDQQFELAINMDSWPEINREEAMKYLQYIKQHARYFWSVNQEAEKTTRGGMTQNRVSQMVEEIGGFKRIHRHAYWMEQGYVEELYEITQ